MLFSPKEKERIFRKALKSRIREKRESIPSGGLRYISEIETIFANTFEKLGVTEKDLKNKLEWIESGRGWFKGVIDFGSIALKVEVNFTPENAPENFGQITAILPEEKEITFKTLAVGHSEEWSETRQDWIIVNGESAPAFVLDRKGPKISGAEAEIRKFGFDTLHDRCSNIIRNAIANSKEI